MRIKIWLPVLAILLIATLGGCENNKEKTVIVHKSFIHPDSLEISIEQFLTVGCDKELKNIDVLKYLDNANIEYKLRSNSNGYKWYEVYANHKEYLIGFADGRMFAYHQQ